MIKPEKSRAKQDTLVTLRDKVPPLMVVADGGSRTLWKGLIHKTISQGGKCYGGLKPTVRDPTLYRGEGLAV